MSSSNCDITSLELVENRNIVCSGKTPVVESTCMSSVQFPSAGRFEEEKRRILRKRIFNLPSSVSPVNNDDISSFSMYSSGNDLSDFIKYDQISAFLQSEDHRRPTERILFEAVKELITNCPRELKMPYEDEYVVMTLLTTCPRLICMKDEEDDLLLIHYLCIMEYPSHQILRYLVNEYPASVSVYGFIGDLHATPLHLKLMRTEINFEMVLFMVSQCPVAASLSTLHNKYPLHLTLSLSPTTPRQHYFYHFLVQHLLIYYPEAAFHSVQEEINCLSLVAPPSQPSQLIPTNVDDSSTDQDEDSNVHEQAFVPLSSPAPDTPSTFEEADDNMTVFIGQELYKVETKIASWSPVEKVRNSDDEQMKRLFDLHVDRFTRRYVMKQWRR